MSLFSSRERSPDSVEARAEAERQSAYELLDERLDNLFGRELRRQRLHKTWDHEWGRFHPRIDSSVQYHIARYRALWQINVKYETPATTKHAGLRMTNVDYELSRGLGPRRLTASTFFKPTRETLAIVDSLRAVEIEIPELPNQFFMPEQVVDKQDAVKLADDIRMLKLEKTDEPY